MSNASLKEQLQAVASQLVDTKGGQVEAEAPEAQAQTEAPEAKRVAATKPNKIMKPEKTSQKKPKWLEHAQYGILLLKAYFPSAFKEAQGIAPLKKGIKHDLVMRLGSIDTIVIEDKACMVKSLAYYVNTSAYHRAMIAGHARLDLDGKAVESVTIEEALYAKGRLDEKSRPNQSHAHAKKSADSSMTE